MRRNRSLSLIAVALTFMVASAWGAEAPTDSSMTLKGGDEGTAFRSLTIEAENQVQIEFERPPLHIELDPLSAPGLELGSAHDVLDRTLPDFAAPFVGYGRPDSRPYLSRPWLRSFRRGDLAQFHPQLEGVERWTLFIADSKGRSVRSYEGKGTPPRLLSWDGADSKGIPCPAGLTYSFVLNAYDRAGNERNFVGDSFTLPPYAFGSSAKPLLLFAAEDRAKAAAGGVDPLVLELASRLNQSADATSPILLQVQARSYEQGQSLGQSLAQELAPWLIGPSARLRVQTEVDDAAPRNGAFRCGLESDSSR